MTYAGSARDLALALGRWRVGWTHGRVWFIIPDGITEALSRLGAVRAAYLFGSHVEGTPDQWSDIDVALFMEGVEHWDIHQRATAMALVMAKVGNDVEAHLFPASSLDHPPRAGFAAYLLRHGTRIFEHA